MRKRMMQSFKTRGCNWGKKDHSKQTKIGKRGGNDKRGKRRACSLSTPDVRIPRIVKSVRAVRSTIAAARGGYSNSWQRCRNRNELLRLGCWGADTTRAMLVDQSYCPRRMLVQICL